MNDTTKTWESCLNEIESSISKANFSTWFKHTHLIKEDGGVVFVGVPNEFVKEWLVNKYHKLIMQTLEKFFNYVRGVEYIITKYESKNTASAQTAEQKV